MLLKVPRGTQNPQTLVWWPLVLFSSLPAQERQVDRDLKKRNNLPNTHSMLATGPGPESRFPFQVSALNHNVLFRTAFPKGAGNCNNESFVALPWMRWDRVHLSFPTGKSSQPLLLLLFSVAQAGTCLPLCSLPRFCGAKKDRERADSGRSWWHRCFLSPGPSGCLSQQAKCHGQVCFSVFQALGGGRCL